MEENATITEAFELVEAGQGRWEVQRRNSFGLAGYVWRTDNGFVLYDWLDNQVGIFPTLDDALRHLLALETNS